MSAVGFPLRFPLDLGGPEDLHEVEQQAILAELAPGLDVDSNEGLWCEAYADATALEFIWACNKRLAAQGDPEKMIDALPDWEGACGLRPTIKDTDIARRNRLSAWLRGLGGNAIKDIEAAARKLLGPSFVSLEVTPAALEVNYWPGVNPGPPGREWSSNRARIAIVVRNPGLDDETFQNQLGAVSNLLLALLQASKTFAIDSHGAVT